MEHMKTIRKQKGMSVEELSAKTGLSTNMIWSYEAGRRAMPVTAAVAIADALDVSLDLLIRGKEKDRSKERSMDDAIELFKRLPAEDVTALIAIANVLLSRRGE